MAEVKPKPELKIQVIWSEPGRAREIWVEREGRMPKSLRKLLKSYGFKYYPLARAWIATNFSTYEFARLARDIAKYIRNFEVRHEYLYPMGVSEQ